MTTSAVSPHRGHETCACASAASTLPASVHRLVSSVIGAERSSRGHPDTLVLAKEVDVEAAFEVEIDVLRTTETIR